MVKRAQMPLAQMEIVVPPSPNAKAELTEEDKLRAYADAMGADVAARQHQLALAAKSCSCGIGDAEKRLDRHKPGCHKHPMKFGRRA